MKEKYNIYGTSRFHRDTFYYIVSYNASEYEAIIIGKKYFNSVNSALLLLFNNKSVFFLFF